VAAKNKKEYDSSLVNDFLVPKIVGLVELASATCIKSHHIEGKTKDLVKYLLLKFD
jgi:hypothetical protein